MSLGHDAGLCGSTWSPSPIWKWVRFSRTSRSVSEESGWYLARVKTSHMVTPNDQTSLLDENLPCTDDLKHRCKKRFLRFFIIFIKNTFFNVFYFWNVFYFLVEKFCILLNPLKFY